MAIYHLQARVGRRSTGQSAGAHVAYVLRIGKYRALTRRLGADTVRQAESANMPSWVLPGEERSYWDRCDLDERSNGILFRSLEFAIPRELSSPEQVSLVRDFAEEIATVKGGNLPITWAIHEGQGHNPHAHLLMSERINDGMDRDPERWFRRANKAEPERGGAPKANISSRRREWLEEIRNKWAVHANRALQAAGFSESIDHRSNADRGLTEAPGVHLGPARWRALRERSRRVPVSQIARTDIAIQAASRHRRLCQISEELKDIEIRLERAQRKHYESSLLGHKRSFTIGEQHMIEQNWDMTTEKAGKNSSEDDLNKKTVRDGHKSQLAIEEMMSVEMFAEEVFDSRDISFSGGGVPMGSLNTVSWPCVHHLALLVGTLTRTRHGDMAVAYRWADRCDSPRPLMVDYGDRILCYSDNPDDQKKAVEGMVKIASERGWVGISWHGGRDFLRRAVIESELAGKKWTINPNSAYQPSPEELAAWKAEALAKRSGGSGIANENTAEDTQKLEADDIENKIKGMSTSDLVERAQTLRRSLDCEFIDDMEDEHEAPRPGN